jgi:hypothetical protein
MPSSLVQLRLTRRGSILCCLGAALVAGGVMVAVLVTGCAGAARGHPGRMENLVYPPPPQVSRVVALGNISGHPPLSRGQIELALFLFGEEPPTELSIANPSGITFADGNLLICDSALGMILKWNARSHDLERACRTSRFTRPFAIKVAPEGQRLICDQRGVWRCGQGGEARRAYEPESGGWRPAGVLPVGQTVWVTDDRAHRIDIFDLESGKYLRSVGRKGTGPGEFALPRSMALTPEGNVCVVDTLNTRVQVLSPEGDWLRNIGKAGDTVGSFGRPKDVAVGPDGTVFVTDAFSQRVHAFASNGQPLLAFGEPGSGVGALALPNGITIATAPLSTERELPPDTVAEYYVLVAEQMLRPGVRVYAWLGQNVPGEVVPVTGQLWGPAAEWHPHFPESTAINPHWDPDRCGTCHQERNGEMLPIPPADVDPLCLSCHDGVRAPADPHPIGRPADTEHVQTPDTWPTVDGMIGCLTCHDIYRHCDVKARRPAVNAVLLRGYDPQRPLEYCGNCHLSEAVARFSPHQQRDASGRIREQACLFCHTERPELPADGRRTFEPRLRTESSDLCLNCHTPHWDLSPKGHVDRPVTPRIRQWMLMRELSLEYDAPPRELARMAAASKREPARLPLGDGMVTCYTCHNPHYAGLFPPDSELGALAENPLDRASALRTDWIDLCSECHHH